MEGALVQVRGGGFIPSPPATGRAAPRSVGDLPQDGRSGASEPVEVVLEGLQARSFCLRRQGVEEALEESQIGQHGADLGACRSFRVVRHEEAGFEAEVVQPRVKALDPGAVSPRDGATRTRDGSTRSQKPSPPSGRIYSMSGLSGEPQARILKCQDYGACS